MKSNPYHAVDTNETIERNVILSALDTDKKNGIKCSPWRELDTNEKIE